MRICLLTNQDLDSGNMEDDWPADPRPYLPEAEWHLLVLEKETAVRQVMTAALQGFDLFFNLCDGAWDEETPGIEVVLTLERLELPFTGATSEFYEPSREAMKRVCRACGIDTPAHVLARGPADIIHAGQVLRFPLFVKHPSSYASIGITRDSKVESPQMLAIQAGRMIEEYGGALIEEFVDGTEYTVLVAENADDPEAPIAYQSVEYHFPFGESFKHSDLKWVEYEKMITSPVRDAELDRRLREAAALFFRGLHGAGYGRCDIRVDADGRIFMLEINANCGVFFEPEDAGSADFCLLNDPRGHEGFTRAIIAAAFARHRARSRNWKVSARRDGGTIVARHDIAAGERIFGFDGETHRLASTSRLERDHADDAQPRSYDHAWPLTDDLWVMRARDPDAWLPIRHSCDPSAWFEGLDIVARRPLAEHDEITLDYATFHNERMPSFDCSCDAPECRGTIHGGDYLKGFVDRYGDHVSPYVRDKRNGASGSSRPRP